VSTEFQPRVVAFIRDQLGESPWVAIAAAVADALEREAEITLPGLVGIAEKRGFDWRDVHVVVEKLAQAPSLVERVFLSMATDPPVVVPSEEVARRLRASIDDPEDGRAEWLDWARGVKVLWRRQRPPVGGRR
jgi:hypothetical protein